MSVHPHPQFSDTDFTRSSYCVYPPGGCVEVAVKGDTVAIRDSTNPLHVLYFTKADWVAFLNGVKVGEFDGK